MDYKYNEELYGEVIFKNGFQTNYIKSELVILVKYLKYIEGKNKKETETFLYDFCKKYIEGFNEVKYYKVIDSAIRKGRKKDNLLVVIKDIPILKSELNYLDSLDINHEYKKFMLSLLFYKKIKYKLNRLVNVNAKMSVYISGNNKIYRDIFKAANISGKFKVDDIVNDLVKEGLIISIVKGDIVLDFMYDIYDTIDNVEEINDKSIIKKEIQYKEYEEDIYDYINNFDNIGLVFDYYKGENKVKKCEVCGRYIKTKNNRNKYCPECFNKERRKYKTQKQREYREHCVDI